MARWSAALAGALSFTACVNDDIPARPIIPDAASLDGADASDAPDAGGDDGPPQDDGPGPKVLASSPGCESIRLVVSGGTLFWTEKASGTVKSVPTAGGSTTVLATGQTQPSETPNDRMAPAIAVDATFLFWVNDVTKTVMRKPLAGGAATVLVDATKIPEILGGENDINALLVDGDTLFFGRSIRAAKVPIAGGVSKVIMQSPEGDRGKPGAFAIHKNFLFQTELEHLAISRETTDGLQMGLLEDRVTKQPLAPDRIAISQTDLVTDAIAIFEGNVVWANNVNIKSTPVDTADFSIPVTIGPEIVPNLITGFVISGDVLYFGETGDNVVESVPLSVEAGVILHGDSTVIARNQPGARQFAADADNIYWSTAECKIMKLAK